MRFPLNREASENLARPRHCERRDPERRTPRLEQQVLVGHGGEHRAVFVYQFDSYCYWQGRLGRHDFTYGQFGENFTVDGLADDEVCIGNRYWIGSALFEVTQPRVTCYRVGIRMNEPQWRPCSPQATDQASTSVCCRRVRWGRATKSSRSPTDPSA